MDGLKSSRGEAVLFRVEVSSGTKATGVTNADENAISSLQVLTFAEGGELDGYASGEAGSSEAYVSTFSGVHDIYAVVNSAHDFSGVASRTEFLSYFQDLVSQSPDCLVMIGKKESYNITSSGTLTLPVHHFVCRVVLGKVTNKLIPEALSSKEFRVLEIYLTNVPSAMDFGMDGVPPVWYNMMGYHAGVADELLHDAVPVVSQVVALNSSLNEEHRFYYIPNLQEEDVFSDTWSPRHTRLVVKASIGGDVFYYPVTLPVSPSNASYEIDNLVIARQGSLLEESVLPYAAVTFDTSVSGWNPESESGEFVASHAIVLFTPDGVDPFELVEEYIQAGYTGNPMIVFGDGNVSPFTYIQRIAEMEVDGGVLFFAEPGLSVWEYVPAWEAELSSDGTARVIEVDASGVNAFVAQELSLEVDQSYLIFEILTSGSLRLNNVGSASPSCYVSYQILGSDTGWSRLGNSYVNFDAGSVIVLRGHGPFYIDAGSHLSSSYFEISSGLTFRIRGSLSYLMDGNDSLQPNYFRGLFHNCTGLVDASELDLPWNELSSACFMDMFSGCTGLTSAPELPATTLAQSCYCNMFQGCTSLTAAPVLPATTLELGCYSRMFSDCTGLTSAPELPATNLEYGCYNSMFNGCTGLTSAPELPATTLASSCYSNMFQGCTGLTNAPELPATILASYCYSNMFYGCTSLTSAPELPATTLVSNCYRSMYSGCTGLTVAPVLPATTLAQSCYSDMFSGCTGLTSAPVLPATTLAASCYYQMFSGCTGLTVAPVLPATILADICYYGMFSGCTGLTVAPVLPATTLAASCYRYMFQGCTSIIAAPALPATTLAAYCYANMFEYCHGLRSSPDLPATSLADYCYHNMFFTCHGLLSAGEIAAAVFPIGCCSGMFSWCINLRTPPQMAPTTVRDYSCQQMFYECEYLLTPPNLPATTLGRGCYKNMFDDCIRLSSAPALPAFSLMSECYFAMFRNCWELETAPDLLATTTVSDCYDYMFENCKKLSYVKCHLANNSIGDTTSWLSGVRSTGTFVKAQGSSWSSGESAIPSGWTVVSE